MKMIKCCGSFLILITTFLSTNLEASQLTGFEVEGRVSAFFPSSNITRRIFSDVMPYYELEISQTFCHDWQIWLGGGYLSNDGRSIGCKNKTHFRLIPITLGIKYLYSIASCMNLYAGAGASFGFLDTVDYSPYVHKNNSKDAFGGIFKLGYTYRLDQCLFIDIFSEYLYQRFSFRQVYEDQFTVRNDVNMSGFKIGAGIGYSF